MTEYEIAVIQAAMDYTHEREGAHYGPNQENVKRAFLELNRACDALAGEHEGQWREPEPTNDALVPEMIEALRDLVHASEVPTGRNVAIAIDKARALLARIEGETK